MVNDLGNREERRTFFHYACVLLASGGCTGWNKSEFLTGKRVKHSLSIGNMISCLNPFAYFCSISLQTTTKTYKQVLGVFASVWGEVFELGILK
jgi:hypothetical protein